MSASLVPVPSEFGNGVVRCVDGSASIVGSAPTGACSVARIHVHQLVSGDLASFLVFRCCQHQWTIVMQATSVLAAGVYIWHLCAKMKRESQLVHVMHCMMHKHKTGK